jgi:hypothetical protein
MWMNGEGLSHDCAQSPAVVSAQRDSCTIGSSGDVNDKSLGGPWAHP